MITVSIPAAEIRPVSVAAPFDRALIAPDPSPRAQFASRYDLTEPPPTTNGRRIAVELPHPKPPFSQSST